MNEHATTTTTKRIRTKTSKAAALESDVSRAIYMNGIHNCTFISSVYTKATRVTSFANLVLGTANEVNSEESASAARRALNTTVRRCIETGSPTVGSASAARRALNTAERRCIETGGPTVGEDGKTANPTGQTQDGGDGSR